MTRLLYDVAVITDYSRRKINENDREKHQHQNQLHPFADVKPSYDVTEKSTSNAISCQSQSKDSNVESHRLASGSDIILDKNTADIRHSSVLEAAAPFDYSSLSDFAASYEIAGSVSGYSSVGTISSIASSSVGSLDDELVLWTQNVDGQTFITARPKMGIKDGTTPNKDDKEAIQALDDNFFCARIVTAPCDVIRESLKANLKSNKRPKESIFSLEDNSKEEERGIPNTGLSVAINASVDSVLEIPTNECEPSTSEYQLPTINGCQLFTNGCQLQPEVNENETLEASLKRVAQQLYELDPGTMMSTLTDPANLVDGQNLERGVGVNGVYNSDLSQGAFLWTQDVQNDNVPFENSPLCPGTAAGSLQEDVWFTAESDNQGSDADVEWVRRSLQASFIDDVINANDPSLSLRGSRLTSDYTNQNGAHQSEHHQNDDAHQPDKHLPSEWNERRANLNDSAGDDTGFDVGDVTNQTRDVTQIENTTRHPILESSSKVRINKALGGIQGNASTVNDSGFANSINVTNFATPFKLNNRHERLNSRKDSCVPEELDAVFESDDIAIEATFKNLMIQDKVNDENDKNYEDDKISQIDSKPLVIQKMTDIRSPYHCNVQHGNDFMNFSTFISCRDILPDTFLSDKNAISLLSISQRVVRIRVNKPYQPADPQYERNNLDTCVLANQKVKDDVKKSADSEDETKFTDHYGTGFAFYVDSNKIQVRTHSRLVQSASEAEKTDIQFNVYLPATEQWLSVEAKGRADDFYTNIYSHTSVMTCVTPSELAPHLNIFEKIPVQIESSLFSDSISTNRIEPIIDSNSSNCSEVQSTERKSDKESIMSLDDSDSTASSSPVVHLDNKSRLHQSAAPPSVDIPEEEEEETSTASTEDGENIERFPKQEAFSYDSNTSSVESRMSCSDGSGGDSSRESISSNITDNSDSTDNSDITDHSDITDNTRDQNENPFAFCGLRNGLMLTPFESVYEKESDNSNSDSPFFDNHYLPQFDNFEEKNASVTKGDNRENNLVPSSITSLSEAGSHDDDCVFTTATAATTTMKFGSSSKRRKILEDKHPIPGVTEYTPFSSFAGDLLESLMPIKNSYLNCSVLDLPSGKWDYEALVYFQNHCRNEYRSLCRTKLTTPPSKRVIDNFISTSPVTSTTSQSAGIADDRETESDSWDYDLLGLDSKLMPMIELPGGDFEFEKLVEDILSDDTSDDVLDDLINNNRRDRVTSNDSTNYTSGKCIIVSHPHGGLKQVSHGSISTSNVATSGGKFYSAPSCFGCCGAPILSFNQNGDLYVSTTIHNGTTRLGDNGPYRGFGLAFLSQSACEFSQCTSV